MDTPTLLPFVSIVVPIFNEEKSIQKCLSSLTSQSYPKDRYEIILIDGGSTDLTQSIIKNIATTTKKIRVLSNPDKLIAKALNIGLHASQGDIIARMDGHSIAQSDYVSLCVEYLTKQNVASIGGYVDVVGEKFWGRCIALGSTCSFGVGNAQFRMVEKIDSPTPGFPGAFWKKTLLDLGGWDESFTINEDDELFFRMKEKGLSLYTTSKIITRYLCRNSLVGLWQQYFRYGFWKAKVILKHGKPEAIRHLVPSLFVLFLLVGGIASLFTRMAFTGFLSILSLYALMSIVFSIKIAWPKSVQYLPGIPFVFLALHLSYGTGLLCGLPRFVLEKSK